MVVSVIALLVAVLLPHVSRAREQTKRVVCACNLRSINLASESYAIEFGTLPIMNRQGYDINYRKISGVYLRQDIRGFGPETWPEYLNAKNFWTGSPFRGLIFQVDLGPSTTAAYFGEWRNFGLLWRNRAIAEPRVLFCPSQRDRYYAWNNDSNPWPPRFETIHRPDNPAWANHTESSYERRLGLTGVAWDRIAGGTGLQTDRLLDENDSPDIVRDTHRGGINVMYRDGRNTFIRDRRLLAWIPYKERQRFWEARDKLLELYDWIDHQAR